MIKTSAASIILNNKKNLLFGIKKKGKQKKQN